MNKLRLILFVFVAFTINAQQLYFPGQDWEEKTPQSLGFSNEKNVEANQFAIKNDTVYIIEANPRASRTVPFISKAYKQPYVNYATKIMLGKNKIGDFKFESKLDGFAIKQPVFSFSKFPNVNKNLGPEMKSTGESILFIEDLKDDDFYEIYSRRKMYLTK